MSGIFWTPCILFSKRRYHRGQTRITCRRSMKKLVCLTTWMRLTDTHNAPLTFVSLVKKELCCSHLANTYFFSGTLHKSGELRLKMQIDPKPFQVLPALLLKAVGSHKLQGKDSSKLFCGWFSSMKHLSQCWNKIWRRYSNVRREYFMIYQTLIQTPAIYTQRTDQMSLTLYYSRFYQQRQ